ncbi:MAG: alpha/beta hydrolase [Rhizobiales bacterium]|nr:alpha/beta hydrolase [Hyphomicrobiales bacterium]
MSKPISWRPLRSVPVLVLLSLLLASCATRPFESAELRTETPIGAIRLFDANGQPVSDAPVGRVGDNLEILALSGGGADGAFGAGVLNGWSASGNRPKFDVVTGVSTGALIAALAFLGPGYDATLKDLYTNTTDAKVFRRKSVIGGLLSESFLDYTPLQRQIERVVTPGLVNQIGNEHRRGRRLYVATTNLDAGELTVWDIGAIAASNFPSDIRTRVVQKILRASAAVPGLFKPVYFRPRLDSDARQMHVDGGVKAPVLIRSFMFKVPAKKRTVYVIVNGQIKLVDAKEPVEPEVAAISRKSITELLRGLLYKTLYQGYVSTRNARGRFRLMAIPDHVPAAKDPLEFDPAEMRALFETGYAMGRSGQGWANEPPRLEAFERVSN